MLFTLSYCASVLQDCDSHRVCRVPLELCNMMVLNVPKGPQIEFKIGPTPFQNFSPLWLTILFVATAHVPSSQVGTLGSWWLNTTSISTSFFHFCSLVTLSPCRSQSALLNLNQVTALPCSCAPGASHCTHHNMQTLYRGPKGLILCHTLLITQVHEFQKCGPCTVRIIESLLEMQILGPHQTDSKRNSGGWGPAVCLLTSLLGDFDMTLASFSSSDC